MTKHDKNERKVTRVPKFNPSPQTILQMNATVIAGLFILLTFQVADLPSQEELVLKVRSLDIEESLLKEMSDNSDTDFESKIKERLSEIKIERETLRAELTSLSKIPYVIYTQVNPISSTTIIIIPFIGSSAIILLRGISKAITDDYHPKWSLRLSLYGFFIMGAYFLYELFPIGRFLTDQFIFP